MAVVDLRCATDDSFGPPVFLALGTRKSKEWKRRRPGESTGAARLIRESALSESIDVRPGSFLGWGISLFRYSEPGPRAVLGNAIDVEKAGEMRSVAGEPLPSMGPPHLLKLLKGPECDGFTEAPLGRFVEKSEKPRYTVITRLNRTGMRIDGHALQFPEGAEKSIISEGALPGTVQAPGDGLPMIVLYQKNDRRICSGRHGHQSGSRPLCTPETVGSGPSPCPQGWTRR